MQSSKKTKSVRKRSDYEKKHYWKQGDPLTPKDELMLEEVRSFYKIKGYIPSKKEISNAVALKGWFRTWKEVINAAGLPSLNDGEEVRKRQEAARKYKGIKL